MKLKKNDVLLRKIYIIISLILLSVLCIWLMVQNYLKLKEQRFENATVSGNFESIKDILEYYDCKYKKTKKSELEGFSKDIYTEFKCDLYEDEQSNEEFYNMIIKKIAEFLNYQNFRLIDDSKNEKIEIKVICDKDKIKTVIINNIEDYFIYMDSQIDAKKYKRLKEINLNVQSPELLSCIENNWDKSVDFGTKEAIYKNYNIYFDEGISVRTISNNIYNVVFSEKYEKNVVNGLKSSSKRDIIKRELGEPTFKNSDNSIIGYKSKDMYVFFSENEISVYRKSETDYEEFFKLVKKYIDKDYSFLDFMNELTYIWPDYETYEYGGNKVFLSYPAKGIDIKVNYDNFNGIIFYNNIGFSQAVARKYFENTDFISQMKIDGIYNAEIRRINDIKNSELECENFKKEYEKEDDFNHSKIYDYYMKFDSFKNIQEIYFISKSDEYCNNQLLENINNYIWIDDTTFLYSKKNRGIFKFDLARGQKTVVLTGNDIFHINSYENGVLNYDETSINL